jgi:hypothetical protein
MPNPYYPVAAAATWQYHETRKTSAPGSQGADASVTSASTTTVTRVPASPGFVEQTKSTGDPTPSGQTRQWTCLPEGAREETSADSVLELLGGANLGPWQLAGVDLPPVDRWVAGARWSTSAEASAKAGATSSVNHVTSIKTYEVAAVKKVTVPAGTYDALEVHVTLLIDVDTPTGKLTLLSGKGTNWYVRDVGLVKSVSMSELKTATGATQTRATSVLTAFTRDK